MRVCSFFDSSVCAGQHRGKCGIRWMGLPQKSGALQEGRYFPKKKAADHSAARRHSQNLSSSLTRHDLPESARICRDFSRSRRRAVRVTRSVHPRGP